MELLQRMSHVACLLCARLLSACASTAEPSTHDASRPDTHLALPPEPDVAEPARPMIPWESIGVPPIDAPRLTSVCPPGWAIREIEEGVSVCHPYPDGRSDDCGATGAHWPGEHGCRDLDTGAGAWPRDLPTEGVLYVRPGVSGDGSRASPLATISAALARATMGSTIALAEGVHEVEATLDIDGVRIVGASAARTTLRGTGPEGPTPRAMLRARAARLELRDVSLEASHRAVIAEAGSEITLRSVRFTGPGAGLRAEAGSRLAVLDAITFEPSARWIEAVGSAAHVRVDHLAILGEPAPWPVAGGVLVASEGAHLEVTDTIARGGRLAPVRVEAGSSAVLTRVVTVEAHAHLNERGMIAGNWLWIERPPIAGLRCEPGFADLRDVVVVGAARGEPSVEPVFAISGCHGSIARAVAVNAPLLSTDAPVTVEDVISRGAPATAILVYSSTAGSSAVLRRLDLRRGAISGLSVAVQEEATVEDLVVAGVRSREGRYGTAVSIQAPMSSLRRLRISDSVAGVLVSGGHLVLEDTSLASMSDGHAEAVSAGLLVSAGGSISGRRVLMDGTARRGVWIANEGRMELDDVIIRGLRTSDARGVEINALAFPSVLRRVEISDGFGTGVAVQGPVAFEDLSVHDLSTSDSPAYGIVLAPTAPRARSAPVVSLERASVLDVEGSAIRARVPAGATPGRWTARAADLRIARIGGPACEDCLEENVGIDVAGEIDVSLSRFVIREIGDRGLATADGAVLTGQEGLVGDVPSCGALSAPAATVIFAGCAPTP